MGDALMDWLRERWVSWAAGALLWVALAVGATVYANRHGLIPWHLVVTWDEWVVAIGLTLRLIVPIFRKSEVVSRRGQQIVSLAGDFTRAIMVVFLLDLVARAVLGLGWDPF